ncbi:hypothetical protein AAHE18_01G141900 [Arachis hypogaea]
MNSSNTKVPHPNAGKDCEASSFSHIGISLPNLTAIAHPIKRFHALSGFFFVYNKLNLSPRANLTMVAYMASLIDYGMCLGDVEVVFGPGDVSWTLGAAMVEGKFLWLNSTNRKAETIISTLKNVKVVSSPTLLFAVLVFVLLIVNCSQIKLPMPSRRASASGLSLPTYTHIRRRSF